MIHYSSLTGDPDTWKTCKLVSRVWHSGLGCVCTVFPPTGQRNTVINRTEELHLHDHCLPAWPQPGLKDGTKIKKNITKTHISNIGFMQAGRTILLYILDIFILYYFVIIYHILSLQKHNSIYESFVICLCLSYGPHNLCMPSLCSQ